MEAMGLAGQHWSQSRAHPGEQIPLEVLADAAVKALADYKLTAETSPEIAALAGRLMHHPEEDVRRLAASALVQTGVSDD
jgi:hypothetical protein